MDEEQMNDMKMKDIISVMQILVPPDKISIEWIVIWLGFAVVSAYAGAQLCVHSDSASRQGDIEQGNGGEGRSSGDTTRRLFHKLLFVALLSRLFLLPIQVYANHTMFAFAAITFPEMAFASAWTLLVSFFVQLVGTASGAPFHSNNSFVMQAIAYVMYGILMVVYVWNDSAVLLLYALLCVIYAALFATLVYFGPKLLSILRPSLARRSGLAFRLVVCNVLCILVFGAQTVGIAKNVLLIEGTSGTEQPAWWYYYGLLELFPAFCLLLMMKKKTRKASSERSPNGAVGTPPTPPNGPGLQRTFSGSGGVRHPPSQPQQQHVPNTKNGSETTALLKPSSNAYGAVSTTENS